MSYYIEQVPRRSRTSENFYGERVGEDLDEVPEGQIKDSGRVLSNDMSVGRARGCDAVVSSVTGQRSGPLPKWTGRLT